MLVVFGMTKNLSDRMFNIRLGTVIYLHYDKRYSFTKRRDLYKKISGKWDFLFSWDMTCYNDVIEEWENLVPFKYNKCFDEFFIGYFDGFFVFKYSAGGDEFKRFKTFTELCNFLTTIDS